MSHNIEEANRPLRYQTSHPLELSLDVLILPCFAALGNSPILLTQYNMMNRRRKKNNSKRRAEHYVEKVGQNSKVG
jgi:hypothetical protein